ncbi:MAG: hypothetical protein ACO1OB_29120 [Archangium sp.]
MGRSSRLFVVTALISAPAFATGFGLEVGGGYSTLGPSADFAADLRIPSEVMGALEIKASGSTFFRTAATDVGVSLMPRYRTPYAKFGAFAFTVAGGIGAFAVITCDNSSGVCGYGGAGPVIQVSPTLALRKSDLFQPFVALNGTVASTWTEGANQMRNDGRLFLAANLPLGVAFDFSGNPKKSPDERLLPAVPTTPVQPSSGEPESSTPTPAPTTPITPPQDVKPAPAPPSPELIPEQEPEGGPPPALIPTTPN